MPSRKGLEQALTWLKSKMAEKDTLDAINAEVAYNVILDLKERKQAIGALYHMTKVQNRQLLGLDADIYTPHFPVTDMDAHPEGLPLTERADEE